MKSLDYLFISKEPIQLECGLVIPQYSISEIENSEIGYKRYEDTIWTLTRYPYEFKFDLEDVGVDYNTLDAYDIFIILNQHREYERLIEELNFIFDDNFTPRIESNNNIIFVGNKGNVSKENINEIKSVLSKIFFMGIPKERKPANEQAKELIKKQIKLNSKKKVNFDLYSIIESLIWNKNSSETYDTILNRSIHQIYAGYRTIEKINNFNNTMNGYYAGVISKENINFEAIHWINKI